MNRNHGVANKKGRKHNANGLFLVTCRLVSVGRNTASIRVSIWFCQGPSKRQAFRKQNSGEIPACTLERSKNRLLGRRSRRILRSRHQDSGTLLAGNCLHHERVRNPTPVNYRAGSINGSFPRTVRLQSVRRGVERQPLYRHVGGRNESLPARLKNTLRSPLSSR